MSFEAQLTVFGYGSSMTGKGWPDYVMLDNGRILSVEYETRTYYPVDRDALLALAEEMDMDAGRNAYIDDYFVNDYARRIREACGGTADE